MSEELHEPSNSDLVWGARGIAAAIGCKPSQVYYLISRGKLPVVKLGRRTIIASRRKLQCLAETT
jgi:hypothetical protein